VVCCYRDPSRPNKATVNVRRNPENHDHCIYLNIWWVNPRTEGTSLNMDPESALTIGHCCISYFGRVRLFVVYDNGVAVVYEARRGRPASPSAFSCCVHGRCRETCCNVRKCNVFSDAIFHRCPDHFSVFIFDVSVHFDCHTTVCLVSKQIYPDQVSIRFIKLVDSTAMLLHVAGYVCRAHSQYRRL